MRLRQVTRSDRAAEYRRVADRRLDMPIDDEPVRRPKRTARVVNSAVDALLAIDGEL